MTVTEVSDLFDYWLSKSIGGIMLDEYKKSLYLTRAQHGILGDMIRAFEYTDELRHLIAPAIVDDVLPESSFSYVGSLQIATEDMNKVLTVLHEKLNDTIAVIPIDFNDKLYSLENPFRKPDKNVAYRSTAGSNSIKIYSHTKVIKYEYSYVKKPTPIVLENFTVIGLSVEGVSTPTPPVFTDKVVHSIVERAVDLVIADRAKVINNEAQSKKP